MIATAGPAMADAAGPTDYNTEIVSIDPPAPSIELEIIGGDSFVRLEMVEPVEVTILGYQGEDYLRFEADGDVLQNRRSPATWLNQDRYGTEDLPGFVDYQAPPDWERVADDGAYAWHDHRSHWMEEVRPFGAEPGDQVLEATIPMLIDGRAVAVTVESFLLADPPWWPSLVGLLAGAAASGMATRGGHRRLGSIGAVVAAIALILGVIAYRSVPPETEPLTLLWLLPGAGLVLFAFATARARSMATTVFLDGALVAGGALLGYWFWIRRTALTSALIPSDAPANLDRLVVAAAAVAAVILTARGVWGLLRPRALVDSTPKTASDRGR